MASEINVIGKVKVVGPVLQVSPSYEKQELVITTDEQYPQTIMIEFPQGKCANDLAQLKPGDNVNVSINIGGREWVNPQGETKYFNSIKGWRISTIMPAHTAAPAPQAQTSAPAQASPQTQGFQAAADFKEEEHDDLPF